MDGALNDEPTKHPMLDAVLGAAVALFFGGGTYALFLRSSGQLSIPADPTDRQFVENPRYKGWRKKFTDEELEWLGDNRPTKAQEAAILAARRRAYTPVAEIIEAAPVVVFSAPDCPYCDEAKAALREAGVAFTEVAASDWQRAQLTKRTGSRTVPQVFAGGEFVGGCHDGGLGGTVPLLRMGLLQEMAARAAGARDREKQAVERPLARRDGRVHPHAAAGDRRAAAAAARRRENIQCANLNRRLLVRVLHEPRRVAAVEPHAVPPLQDEQRRRVHDSRLVDA